MTPQTATAEKPTANPSTPIAPSGAGLRMSRRFTRAGVNPLDEVRWDRRRTVISNPDGSVVFKMEDVEVPVEWSQLATDIVVSKYFRKAGLPNEPGHENSVRQVVHRLAHTIRVAGEEQGGYFATPEDAAAFEAELAYMLAHQVGAFNSPVWFNCGLFHEYGIRGSGGNFYTDFATGEVSRPEGPSKEFLGTREAGAVLPGEVAEEVELAQAGYPEFDLEAYRHGDLTPVYFGSALKNFGVAELIEAIARFAPPPRPQPSEAGPVEPSRDEVTGFVFKVQANMDPQHRDRIAFMRMVSGTFRRGMKLTPSGLGKPIAVHSPILFFAQDREIADTAEAGDIIGIPNHGTL